MFPWPIGSWVALRDAECTAVEPHSTHRHSSPDAVNMVAAVQLVQTPLASSLVQLGPQQQLELPPLVLLVQHVMHAHSTALAACTVGLADGVEHSNCSVSVDYESARTIFCIRHPLSPTELGTRSKSNRLVF